MTSGGNRLLESWVVNFNDEQNTAYEYDGHCTVLAGPGSGKTRVLVAKVARLLNRQSLGPRGVACLTYNNETVKELRKRLAELGIRQSTRLFVGTVHSFCRSCVIAPFGHLFDQNLKRDLQIAGTAQRERIFREALDENMFRPTRLQFDNYRRTHPLRDTPDWHSDPQYSELINVYESLLRRDGLMDFDDLVLIALNLIRENEFVRRALEARFPYLVIDEYQDLGRPLHLIVEELINQTNIEIFAVGDPDQSIYGFSGADPKYLRDLSVKDGVFRINLTMNYRNAQKIISGSQVALALEEPRQYRSARLGASGAVIFRECPDGLNEQAETIAREIIPALEQNGVPRGKIAILFIDRNDFAILRNALDDAGIQYAGERDQRYPRTVFTRWLEDLAAWCCSFPGRRSNTNFTDLFRQYALMRTESGTTVDLRDLRERTAFFETIVSCTDPEIRLSDWIEHLHPRLDLRQTLANRPRDPDDFEAFRIIQDEVNPGQALANFNLEDFARCGGRNDTVTVTTLHSSKGSEYGVVVMLGLEEGRLPRYDAATDEALAEARRVFYVGMTRAEDAVYMLYSGWYRDPIGREHRDGPSRFVVELQNRLELWDNEIPTIDG